MVAGSFRSALSKVPGGSASTSTLSPSPSAWTGVSVSTTRFRWSVSVQKRESPKSSKRKFTRPFAASAASTGARMVPDPRFAPIPEVAGASALDAPSQP